VSTHPPRSFTLLVNPASGGGAAPGAVVPVAKVLREAGARVEVVYSPGPRAVVGLVAEAIGRGDVVVAVGGDGMVASLVGPVSEGGGTLALLPAGRGNDFARMLGVSGGPDAVEASARLLLEGEVRHVDLLDATVGGERRLVAGSVYCGVDARAAAMVHRMRRVPGALQYPLAAVRAIATYRPAGLRVEVDGEATDHSAALVVVANSGYYGKGMHVAPAASLTDGRLDVVVVEAASRVELLRRFPKLYDGSHVDLPEVTVLSGTSVRLTALGGPAVGVPAGCDGEPFGHVGAAGAAVSVVPGALAVLAP
jgi:diacylglycerol kinase family enzyme